MAYWDVQPPWHLSENFLMAAINFKGIEILQTAYVAVKLRKSVMEKKREIPRNSPKRLCNVLIHTRRQAFFSVTDHGVGC